MLRLLLCLLLNLSTHIGFSSSGEPPNIVFILVDDLGWSDLHCYGHPYHQTPHIDRLAAQGLRFTQAYSPAPICSAARASILTGKSVARLGMEFVTKYAPGPQPLDVSVPLQTPPITLNLPVAEITLAEHLSPLGYHTAFFGKWHVSQHYQKRYLAWHPEYGPRSQGFDFAVEDFGDHPYAWDKRQPLAEAEEGEIPEDSMITQVVNYISAPHDGPFFVMASAFYVHTPVKTRCRWLVKQYEDALPADSPNRQQRIEYAAFVEIMDHHVGRILDAIEASEDRENTLVVLMSDNGGHPEYSANAPLRGSKWNLYEGGIRVPMIARWPGRIDAGTQCHIPVIGYDLVPTFVELAGGDTANLNNSRIDGISLANALEQGSLQDRMLYWHFPYYHPESTFSEAIDEIGVNDFKTSKTRPQSAIRSGKYKLIKFAEDDHTELYDVDNDLSEQHDVRATTPDVAARLEASLEQYLDQVNARRAIRR